MIANVFLELTGFTRRAIGSAFEGETKEEDGQVWADVEIEGIDSEVGICTRIQLGNTALTVLDVTSTGTSSLSLKHSRMHSHLVITSGQLSLVFSPLQYQYSAQRRVRKIPCWRWRP